MDIHKIKQCQQKHQFKLLNKSNVVSVGYGYKLKDNEKTPDLCLLAGVTKKVSKESLDRRDLVPDVLDEIKTDVVEIGYIKALAKKKVKAQVIDPTEKHRPAPPGVSIAHKNVTAGTFSCVVKKGNNRLILSNNHVLSNSNDANIGDAIYQPGPYDGGTSDDQIAVLEDFIPISFGDGSLPTCPVVNTIVSIFNFVAQKLGRQHRLRALNTQAALNYVDCALARPLDESDILDSILEIGVPVGVIEPSLNLEVQKYGRTTQYTTGTILQLGATVQVSYGTNKTAIFSDQIITNAISAGGDSGSAVLDMNKNLVGLLYAGSDTTTILNPMNKVFELLGVYI